MLLRLSARNHLSIYEEQEINLSASKLLGNEQSLVFDIGAAHKVLPVALVYGHNASGKTNFIKALQFMRDSILYSHSRGVAEGGVERIPFALNDSAEHETTLVEADFIVSGVRYQYGFEADDNKFRKEWLYSYNKGKRSRVFERDEGDVNFGSIFKGQKKILVDLMRPNSLFISTATQNDHGYLSDIVRFFRYIGYSSAISVVDQMLNNAFEKREIDPRVIEFLNNSGTGVDGYRRMMSPLPELTKAMGKGFLELLRKHITDGSVIKDDSFLDSEKTEIQLRHTSSDGKGRFLELDRESSGTRRLLLLLNRVYGALDRGGIVVVDEIDASLHTSAAEEVISLFCNPDLNTKGAQLIATIHDTNLLNSKYLRRDQIWFCDKDISGASRLYSLSDMATRSTDDFERGYRQGRYGAVPHFDTKTTTSENTVVIPVAGSQ